MTESIFAASALIALACYFGFALRDITRSCEVMAIFRSKPQVTFTMTLIYSQLRGAYTLDELDSILAELVQQGLIVENSTGWRFNKGESK